MTPAHSHSFDELDPRTQADIHAFAIAVSDVETAKTLLSVPGIDRLSSFGINSDGIAFSPSTHLNACKIKFMILVCSLLSIPEISDLLSGAPTLGILIFPVLSLVGISIPLRSSLVRALPGLSPSDTPLFLGLSMRRFLIDSASGTVAQAILFVSLPLLLFAILSHLLNFHRISRHINDEINRITLSWTSETRELSSSLLLRQRALCHDRPRLLDTYFQLLGEMVHAFLVDRDNQAKPVTPQGRIAKAVNSRLPCGELSLFNKESSIAMTESIRANIDLFDWSPAPGLPPLFQAVARRVEISSAILPDSEMAAVRDALLARREMSLIDMATPTREPTLPDDLPLPGTSATPSL